MLNEEESKKEKAVSIDPRAVVSKGAQFGKGVQIGPYAIIGPEVILDDNVVVKAHANVAGKTYIGPHSQIWSYSSIGTAPQDLKYRGEESVLKVGSYNIFREYSNACSGTEHGGYKTIVGDHNLFMMGTHIAHDCNIGNHCIFANNASLGGHVEINDNAVIGGHSACHQFLKVGAYAMVAGGAIAVQDVPPYTTVQGNPAKQKGLNLIGLKRADFSKDLILDIKNMYRFVYRQNLSLEQALLQIKDKIKTSNERDYFISFMNKITRGISR